jgi:iron complex outermembrane recepter protein
MPRTPCDTNETLCGFRSTVTEVWRRCRHWLGTHGSPPRRLRNGHLETLVTSGRATVQLRVHLMPLLGILFIVPVAAVAQQPMAVSLDASATQSAADPQAGGAKPDSDILNLDIEQLAKTPVTVNVTSMDTPVTSVTKEASTVGRSPAAIFVITPEMIRRSGVTTIPDALRMAPGVEVAQVNSNAWAITARGFNSAYSGKLLVLIDGRSVYNPDFSGVYWDVQDVLLEDVERIEVIRGPGGSLWGANAVNGVINIITKKAKDTQGVYAMAGGGTHERDMEAFRYGGQIGDDLHYRIYGKHFERGPGFDPADPSADPDAWRQGRFGFRADWEPDRDKTNTLTIQGDHYVGHTANSIIPLDFTTPENQTGDHLLMRWRHLLDEDSDWTLQTYYDMWSRGNSLQMETVKTFDVDFQYRFPLTDRHKITCGADFRNVESCYTGGDQLTNWFAYPYSTTNETSQFIQDEIAVIDDRVVFTLGCKLDENPYTGLEYQPTARLLWAPDHKHSTWGAISRAVRTPARNEEQFAGATGIPVAPDVYPRAFGNSGIESEALMAYEIGYREQTTEQFSWDIAMYYNAYEHLVGVIPFGAPIPPPPFVILPVMFTNGPSGETYGVELSGNYSVSERWRLYAQYTLMQMHIANSPVLVSNVGSDPHNQLYLRSAWNLREDLEFDLMARYVDSLMAMGVPEYITMDLRLAWRARKHLELAVVGQNLLQDHHQEFQSTLSSPELSTEVPRGVYGTLTWRR